MRPIQLGDDFTLGELGNFTLGELSLPVDELLELIRSESRSIPVSAYDKLLELYNELENECHSCNNTSLNTIEFPKIKTAANLSKDLSQILSLLINLHKICDIFKIKQHIIDFIEYIIKAIADSK